MVPADIAILISSSFERLKEDPADITYERLALKVGTGDNAKDHFVSIQFRLIESEMGLAKEALMVVYVRPVDAHPAQPVVPGNASAQSHGQPGTGTSPLSPAS